MAKRSKKRIDLLTEELTLATAYPDVYKLAKNMSDIDYEEYITDLKTRIEQSKRGRGSRNKGSGYERTVAKIVKEALDVELVRTPLSGGFQKSKESSVNRGDITCLSDLIDFILHIECKDQKTIKIRDWFKQACEDCPSHRIPILAMHLIQVIKEGKVTGKPEDLVVIRLSDFLSIVDKEKIIIPKHKVVKRRVK